MLFLSSSAALENEDIIQSMRLKIEDKSEGVLDFLNTELEAYFRSPPFDLFMSFASILFTQLMDEAGLSDSGNAVNILLEIGVEFNRDMREDSDIIEYEDDEFGLLTDNHIKTNINEYIFYWRTRFHISKYA